MHLKNRLENIDKCNVLTKDSGKLEEEKATMRHGIMGTMKSKGVKTSNEKELGSMIRLKIM